MCSSNHMPGFSIASDSYSSYIVPCIGLNHPMIQKENRQNLDLKTFEKLISHKPVIQETGTHF